MTSSDLKIFSAKTLPIATFLFVKHATFPRPNDPLASAKETSKSKLLHSGKMLNFVLNFHGFLEMTLFTAFEEKNYFCPKLLILVIGASFKRDLIQGALNLGSRTL